MDPELKSRVPIVVLVALVAGGAVGAWPRAAAAEGRPGYGGVVIGSLLSEPISIDPVEARSHAEVTLVSLVFDTLYAVDGRGNPKPMLAAALPEISEDRLQVRVAIRSGVYFHDGTPLEVGDVVDSLRRLAKSDARWLLAPVREIREAGNDLILDLRRRTPEIARLLAAPAASITPGGKAPQLTAAIGTGPYRLKSFDRGRRRVVLTAAEGHFAGRPYVDELELRWYQSPDEEPILYERGDLFLSLRGEVAFTGHQPKYATDEVEGPATVLVFLGFGTSRSAITDDVDFRRALSMAIARNGFRTIGTGERVIPSLDPASLDIGGDAAPQDEQQARTRAARIVLRRAANRVSLLRDALSGARELSLEVLIDRTRPDDREIAEKVVAALYRLGLSAHITDLDAREFATRVGRGTCDLYVGQLAAPLPSAALTTAAAFAAGRDSWPQRALARAVLVLRVARAEFQKRLPVVPLFHRALRIYHRRDLRGLGFDSIARPTFADIFLRGAGGTGIRKKGSSGGTK